MKDNGRHTQSWQTKPAGDLPIVHVIIHPVKYSMMSHSKCHRVFIHDIISDIYFPFCVFSSQNEPPPPYYSVAVHTQPPLKGYEEVVYGVGPGLTPPTHPRYIPQYPPPVVLPQVTRSSIRECYCSHCFPRREIDEPNTGRQCHLCCAVSVLQPPRVRGRDAVRVTPSATGRQGGSYCCSGCWHSPSGSEVNCLSFTQTTEIDTLMLIFLTFKMLVLHIKSVHLSLFF